MREHMPKIVALVLATTTLCYALTYLRAFIVSHQTMMLAMAWIMAIGITYGSSHSPTLEASGFFMMAMHVFSIYGIFSLRFPAASVGGWASLVIYLAFMSGLGHLPEHAVVRHVGALVLANLWGMLICYQMDLAGRRAFLAVRRLALEHERSDQLLLNILPAAVAKELTTTGVARSARHEAATILFTDFSGFTEAASSMPAERMVTELNEIFSAFDDICCECGIEKIKTIGDAYMAAAGVPTPSSNHAHRCIDAGLRMVSFIEQRNLSSAFKWGLRVGIHSGPVVAGVVGKHKYAFDVWGDTVNVASRMESAGIVGRVNISAYTFDLAKGDFECEYRGKVDAKGKGPIDMYLVIAGSELTSTTHH
ncbi:MAG: adenylate/guanylate cyclase [Rhodocyclaceae bacterium]|nr:MAG: adenylate/guanylate cyclase [Rhodocyclaceae bacterium]TND06000.1 MAG: adenylate/guanylate cyclase [Rhodocyclaceae bacterium]